MCEKCCYKTSNKKDYTKHLSTLKHKNNGLTTENNKKYICEDCKKSFNDRAGLWRHKKKCEFFVKHEKVIDNIEGSKNNINFNDCSVFFELIKQNQEFKNLILEQNKQIIELSSNKNIITNCNNNINSHNKTFNLQVFLNEKCKDALNISDFVNSLKLTLEDLENVGENGFVNGITKIFVNGLKQLDVYKRPIHCSDLKRETMYLKNENVWEKDNENKENMKKVIKQIANKNIKKIYEWKDKYPDCKYSDSKKNDQYSRIIIESMGAKTIEEDQVLYEKIIKNIAKETIIDKTK